MPNKIKQSANPELYYKRSKEGIEIKGDPSDVKWPMWFDLLLSRLPLLIVTIVLACTIPKASFIPIVFKWLQRKLPFLLVSGVVHITALLLSG
jgi:hypothetical protein